MKLFDREKWQLSSNLMWYWLAWPAYPQHMAKVRITAWQDVMYLDGTRMLRDNVPSIFGHPLDQDPYHPVGG